MADRVPRRILYLLSTSLIDHQTWDGEDRFYLARLVAVSSSGTRRGCSALAGANPNEGDVREGTAKGIGIQVGQQKGLDEGGQGKGTGNAD